ncbi:ADP-ribosyltransferase-containing protein [Pseudoxanthomonas kaohsiungensis]|uniref:ART-PolyVal-like domain-containing protein n=1 Tax=Pseudoxanthomonas kaohsiungensis TaxID=283923 RepID=A0ABW3LZW2_9GAMM|nr:hypothetical protein [Pseudoxanthomonas kaohsiungensis]
MPAQAVIESRPVLPVHLDTDAFRAWFGASKVVDAHGAPMVVYHGTPAHRNGLGQNIEAFDRLAVVRFNGARHRLDTVGTWFSTRADELGAAMYGDNVYPVYLSIQSPYVTTFAMMARRAHMLAGTWEGYDENGERPVPGRPGLTERAIATVGEAQVNALRAWLAATGRDGIRVTHDPRGRSTEFKEQDAWIALEPGQIKSALANVGSYDREDPRINFKRAQAEVVELDDEEARCTPKF